MMRALSHYGGPAAMRQDVELERRLHTWSGGRFTSERIGRIAASSAATLGVRQTAIDQQRVRWCATGALAAHLEVSQYQHQLKKLAVGHEPIVHQGRVIGIASACVLWTHLGDPRQYHCAGAYRKAMGLNLKERSSGQYQGQLKIAKRGSGAVRQWLYLCTLRLIRNEPAVKRWYRRKLRRGNPSRKKLITALMRKLSMSLWAIVISGEPFDVDRMLAPRRRGAGSRLKGGSVVRR